MPELPDLAIIREQLAPRVTGVTIAAVEVRRPLVVRNLLGGEIGQHLIGRRFIDVTRRGKFLLLSLDSNVYIVIHPMLAGRIYYGEPLPRHRIRDALVLGLEDGHELRYYDAKDMGKVYLAADLPQVPTFASLGPEAIDPALTLPVFCQRLSQQRGEVKRALTTQSCVAGIGNAYADEICWRAGVYPFRRVASLTKDEQTRLHAAMQAVLAEAIETLRARMGEAIDVEVRDFLSVHGQAGQPCPRCRSAISEVKREQIATHFCRACQPGRLVGG